MVAGVRTTMTSAGYRDLVAKAVAAMEAPAATLRKVVLSRPVTVELDGPLHLAEVLRRLRAGEPNCTIFSMPVTRRHLLRGQPQIAGCSSR